MSDPKPGHRRGMMRWHENPQAFIDYPEAEFR